MTPILSPSLSSSFFSSPQQATDQLKTELNLTDAQMDRVKDVFRAITRVFIATMTEDQGPGGSGRWAISLSHTICSFFLQHHKIS